MDYHKLTEKTHHNFFVVTALICVDFSSLSLTYIVYEYAQLDSLCLTWKWMFDCCSNSLWDRNASGINQFSFTDCKKRKPSLVHRIKRYKVIHLGPWFFLFFVVFKKNNTIQHRQSYFSEYLFTRTHSTAATDLFQLNHWLEQIRYIEFLIVFHHEYSWFASVTIEAPFNYSLLVSGQEEPQI